MYVIQVKGGMERRVVVLIDKYVEDGLIGECFIPKREVARRVRGVWERHEEMLVPGYLFIECDDAGKVADELRRVPAFTRLLGNDDRFIPLNVDETIWFNTFMSRNQRTIRMSEGAIEGERVVVTNGPLVGHEGDIVKVDRHKRLAWMDMSMFGRMKTIKIGLEIVNKCS